MTDSAEAARALPALERAFFVSRLGLWYNVNESTILPGQWRLAMFCYDALLSQGVLHLEPLQDDTEQGKTRSRRS